MAAASVGNLPFAHKSTEVVGAVTGVLRGFLKIQELVVLTMERELELAGAYLVRPRRGFVTVLAKQLRLLAPPRLEREQGVHPHRSIIIEGGAGKTVVGTYHA